MERPGSQQMLGLRGMAKKGVDAYDEGRCLMYDGRGKKGKHPTPF